MSVRRFIGLSAVMAAGVALLAFLAVELIQPDVELVTRLAAAIAASLVSTGGWLIPVVGLGRELRRFPVYFAAGTLAKMLLGIVVVIALIARFDDLPAFLATFIGSFLVLGIAQLVLVARAAQQLVRQTSEDSPPRQR